MKRVLALALVVACNYPGAIRLPSRSEQLFGQPAGLADDYPEETTTPEKIRRDMDTVAAAGARYFRFAVGWDGVESEPGTYDWHLIDEVIRSAREHGIVPLPYVCYTPKWLNPDPKDYWRKPPVDPARFGAFMEAAARRYAGQVGSWELWNEPDNDFYWLGSVDEFARLIRSGADGVRRGDPHAKIVLGGMSKGRSPFLEKLLRDHRLGEVVDVVSVHGYLETWDARRTEDYPAYLDAVVSLVHEAAPQDDVWMAEFGYSDWKRPDGKPSEWSYAVNPWEHTARFQAIALLRAHALALGTGELSLTTWYRVDDLPPAEGVIGDDNNKHLGVLDVRGQPKPAFHAMQLWNRLLSAPVRPVAVRAPEDVVVRAFEDGGGELIVLAWIRSAREGETLPPQLTVTLRLPRAFRSVEAFDPLTGEQTRSGATLEGAALTQVPLQADSIFIARLR